MTSSTPSGLVISGYGASTPLGNDWSTTSARLHRGDTGYEREELNGRSTCFGRLESLEVSDSEPRYDRLAQLALKDLLEQTDVPEQGSLGVVATSSKGNLGQPDVETISGSGNPGLWAGKISDRFPNSEQMATPNTACATGLSALIHAGRWLRDGTVDHALVVTSESCFHPLLLAGYQNLKVLCDSKGMRPFHPNRSGFALSEGAAALHLTTQSFRSKHNLSRHGHLLGWSETCDAHHMTNMRADGSEVDRAIERSLERSGLTQDDVDLLHAHLTTTETNDKVEANLLRNWKDRPILQAVKPSLGHTIGAAGLLEVIATLDVLNGAEPFPLPTTNRENLPNPKHHPEEADPGELKVGLTWNMGFGGHNAAAVVKT